MHISLSDEIQTKLDDYAKNRKKSKSAVVRDALDTLFDVEHVDVKKQSSVNIALKRKFELPRNTPAMAFYWFLYLLAKNFPGASSKMFWPAALYSSNIDRNNKELFIEVQEEINKLMPKDEDNPKK